MILEEVMNISSNTINLNEMVCPLEDYLDLVCEQCNDILLEININNYKVTKEDLLNPDKLKQVLDKIEKDITEPNKKIKVLSYILNGIIILIGATATITMGITGPNALIGGGIVKRNSIITRIISVIVTIFITNSLIIKQTTCSEFKKIIKTADKSIKKLEKSLEKEDDPKKKKIIKNEINELEKVKKKINDEYTKVQYNIKK